MTALGKQVRELAQQAQTLRDAIDCALTCNEFGIEWLRAWNEGDPDAMAQLDEWVKAHPEREGGPYMPRRKQ